MRREPGRREALRRPSPGDLIIHAGETRHPFLRIEALVGRFWSAARRLRVVAAGSRRRLSIASES
jgi:hypothetical protein